MKKKNLQNVLIVHNHYQVPGGEDAVQKNEYELLKLKGHKVSLYTRNNNEINEFTLIDKLLYPINAIFSFKTYREIKKMINEDNIDIVHVHNTWPLISPSVYYAAKRQNIPVFQTVHNFRLICPGATLYYNGSICEDSLNLGLFSAIKNRVYKNSYIQTLISATTLKFNRFMGIYKEINYIFLTGFNKNKILELNKYERKMIIDEKKTFIKPNFVKNDLQPIPFENRKMQFVFAGRLDNSKGIQLLFEAWKTINEYDLIVCGVGPEYEWCNDFIKMNSISNIKLMGFVENTIAREIIAESLGMILPTQWYEGFPITILESFSCGTPVIGSNIGNVGDIIEDGITGFTFQYNSVVDLRKKIYSITDMVRECRETYLNEYTPEKNYTIISGIYNDVD